MKLTVIKDDGVVGVDGEFKSIDLSNLDPQVRAIQFNSSTQSGHIEFYSKPNYTLNSIGGYQWIIDLWNASEQAQPTAEEQKLMFISAVQSKIDSVAQSRGYDSGVSLATYATDTHPPFAAEAAAFIPWRSTVWLYCYTEWAKYEAGLRTFTTPESFVAELPAITWP